MGVIGIIILLVAGLSLYDFFSSVKWQQVTSSNRNEIVFASRNKSYGAYEIRKNYNMVLIAIMLGLALSVAASYGVYRFVTKDGGEEEEAPIIESTQFAIDAPPVEEDIEEPPVEEEVPLLEKSVEFVAPVVTDDKEIAVKITTQEETENTNVSTQTVDNGTDFGKIIEQPKGKVVEEVKPEVIFDDVEEAAEFPGGRAEMMKYLASNIRYPETASQAGIEGKCYLKFVVGTDGNIENVRVLRGVPDCPECDREAVRVVKGMPKWRPGKNGGKSVKSYFNLPVNFKLG